MNRTQTKPCVFYQQNRCKNGAACSFSHNTTSKSSATTASRPPCSFYQQNRCKNGSACTFSHEITVPAESRTTVPTWRATPKIPSPAAAMSETDSGVFIPCRFFQAGLCRSGNTCKFKHVSTTSPNAKSDIAAVSVSEKQHSMMVPDIVSKTDESFETTRVMGETLSVKFGDGLEISSIASASATPIVTLHNLPPNITLTTVKGLITQYLNATHTEPAIRLVPVEDGTYVTVKLGDTATAAELAQKLDGKVLNDHQISAKMYHSKGLASISQSATRVLYSWFAPSKMAFVSMREECYESGKIERITESANGLWIKGRQISCRAQSDSISIGNLSPATTKTDIQRILRVPVDRIDFNTDQGKRTAGILKGFGGPRGGGLYRSDGRSNTPLSNSKAAERIVLMLNSNDIDGHEVVSRPGAGKVKLIIRFKSETAALKAVTNHHRKSLPFLGGSPLYAQRLVTATLKVLPDIHRVIENDLLLVAESQPASVKIKTFKSPNALVTIRITGSDWKTVRSAQTGIGKLVRGDLCTNHDGKAIWDTFFMSDEGKQVIAKAGKEANAHIHVDRRKSTISVYGASGARREAMDTVLSIVKSRGDIIQQEIPLTPGQWRRLIREQLKGLEAEFGQQCVGINVSSRSLVLKGTEDTILSVKTRLALSRTPDLDSTADTTIASESTDDCKVCWTTAENEVRLSCGHSYCTDCLKNFLSTKLDLGTRSFPISCVDCARPIKLSEITAVVTSSELDALLSASFAAHVQKSRDKYNYCPTANCNTVYTPTVTGEIFGCVSCLQTICTTCQVPSHDGQSCADYQASTHENGDADRLFEEWERKNDVKRCPKCRTAIEKSSGCNHMTCVGCKAHICWVCLQVFDTGEEVYPHMTKTHGGIGL